MKNLSFLLIIIFSFSFKSPIQAQRGDYKLRVFTIDQGKKKGYLIALNDSSIVLQKRRFASEKLNETFTIQVDRIKRIKIRRKGKVRQSALKGAGIGFVSLGVLGLAGESDWYSKGELFLITGGIGALYGFGIGALVGSWSVKFPIGTRQEYYEDNRKELENYILKT